MKKLNLYYVISIITLVFMMLILFRTLQATGWFEEHEGKTAAERILNGYLGHYQPKMPQNDLSVAIMRVEPHRVSGEDDWLMIRLDSIPHYLIEVNDFEDEQILIEIYDFDSTGAPQRLDGCELLLVEDEAENFRGSTIGDFCGLKEQSAEYLALDLLLSGPIVSLKILRHVSGQVDRPDTQKYLLERIDSW